MVFVDPPEQTFDAGLPEAILGRQGGQISRHGDQSHSERKISSISVTKHYDALLAKPKTHMGCRAH